MDNQDDCDYEGIAMKIVVLNEEKMNYDHLLDFHQLGDDVVVFQHSSEEEICERVQGATIVITKELVLSEKMVEAFDDSIKLIIEAGTGYNNIPLDACNKKGITVCNIPAYSSQRVAQTAIMLMLNLASSMQMQLRMLERKDHSNFTQHLMVNHIELNGKVLGVVGYGHIAKETIKIALAMGMKVVVTARTPREDHDGIHFTSLEEVLKTSDFISLHCPLNKETYHLIGASQLALMKPTAYLINTARGALIDEQALIKVLQNKMIAGAGLDVLEKEPPLDNSPLYDMENVIITPHMGWKGKETRERLYQIIKSNVDHYLAGDPINVVNGTSR